eukprot:COSAG04_NODE_20751_length_387_cov_0.819444_1_plen_42_part_10
MHDRSVTIPSELSLDRRATSAPPHAGSAAHKYRNKCLGTMTS